MSILMSPLGCKSTKSNQEKQVSILFIDDFENNFVSIKIEGTKVLDSSYFKTSDSPQLRSLFPTFLKIENGVVKRYFSFSSEGEIVATDIQSHSILDLKISIDNINIERKFEKEKGNIILISYMKGNVDVKQVYENDIDF